MKRLTDFTIITTMMKLSDSSLAHIQPSYESSSAMLCLRSFMIKSKHLFIKILVSLLIHFYK